MTNPYQNMNFLDARTRNDLLKAGLANHMWLYLYMSIYVTYDEVEDMVHYGSTTLNQLSEELSMAPEKIQESIDQLSKHGFLNVYRHRDGTASYVLESTSMEAIRETANRFWRHYND